LYVNSTGTFLPVFEQTNFDSLLYKLTSVDTGSPMTGKFFAFKVSAFNVVGESALSLEIVIIAA
jgi:hypothetical protein